jgi:hypothetical protein
MDDLGIIIAHKDSSLINGEVVLSLQGVGKAYSVSPNSGAITDSVELAEYDGNILMARWAPGDSMYSGLLGSYGPAIPGGYRTYITVGHDDEWHDDVNIRARNFYVLTDLMNQVWMNEVARMVHLWMPSDIDTATIGVSDRVVITKQYDLKQNYPNPFNPVTHIEFTLAKSGHTTITIYNVMGRMVEKLVDRPMTSGSHNIVFDAAELASGIYFYRIKSGKFTNIKKMTLLK